MTERLESRRMLAGVVNVDTTTAGLLKLEGNHSNNHVVVHGTGAPGQFVVTGVGTLLTLDGGSQAFTSPLTVNGITDHIMVELGNGADTFELGDDTHPTKVGLNVDDRERR